LLPSDDIDYDFLLSGVKNGTDMQKKTYQIYKEMSTSLKTKNSDHANLIIHQDLIMDVVKLTDRIMVVDMALAVKTS
jgi:hypothetical protein